MKQKQMRVQWKMLINSSKDVSREQREEGTTD